ncbi:DNA-binding protein [Salmonella enterica]|nr:DNA-binding protein [Salmonella enterica]
MAITAKQIMQAADEIAREGLNPTLARVRKKLGGGSFTTISEVMIEWRTQKIR